MAVLSSSLDDSVLVAVYTFKRKSGREFDVHMSIEDLAAFVSCHPELVRVIRAPAIVAGVSSRRSKPDAEFRSLLKNVKKHHRGSTMNVID